MVIPTYFLLLSIPYAASITFNFTDIDLQNHYNDIYILSDGYISANAIQLTPNRNGTTWKYREGRATYIEPLHLWDITSRELASITTYFSFVMDSKLDEYHGDGLTFFLAENHSEIKIGSSMGLPVTNSRSTNLFIVVEFDTFANAEWDPRNSSNDLIGDHALHYIIDMLPEWVTFGFPAVSGLAIQTNSVKYWAFAFNGSDLQSNANNTLPSTCVSNPLNDKNITVLVVSLVIGLFVMITFLTLFAFYVWRRKKSRKDEQGYDVGMNTELEIGTGTKRFSYQELARSSGEF